jgi:hypothetical protein
MAWSRLPGGCAWGIDRRIRRASVQGKARGGRSANRMRGVATHEVRSRHSRPVIRRKRRNDRRELPVSLTVLRDTRLDRSTMNLSTSATITLLTALPCDRNRPRKALAVSRLRPSVASATSQWERRCWQYAASNGGSRAGGLFGHQGGMGTFSERRAHAHAWSALRVTKRV